ncbi:hypothetical protein AC579_2261 [Pseudocercospora musae]|uniref:Uncharacterized protein n=1 Tax=Pseudocercospora musae TaxID=113226 RepID=A0A139IVA2_9PEZI|nr:hypothetical protein AC579_2261 [Pseudocercospora musae]
MQLQPPQGRQESAAHPAATPPSSKKRARQEIESSDIISSSNKRVKSSVQLPSAPESPQTHIDTTVDRLQDAALESAMPTERFAPKTLIDATQLTPSSAPAKPPTPENNLTALE